MILRWGDWNVWGWCKSRGDYRLFKLNRMEELHLSGQKFEKRPTVLPDLSNERVFPGGIHVKILFEAGCTFGRECVIEQADGKFLFEADYTDREYLLTWIMGFRERAIVLEPEELRGEIRSCLEKMWQNYQ